MTTFLKLSGLLFSTQLLQMFDEYQSLSNFKKWNFLQTMSITYPHLSVKDEWNPPTDIKIYAQLLDPIIYYLQQNSTTYKSNIDILLNFLTSIDNLVEKFVIKDIHFKTEFYSDTFLTLCARYEHLDIIEYIIDKYPNINYNGIELKHVCCTSV